MEAPQLFGAWFSQQFEVVSNLQTFGDHRVLFTFFCLRTPARSILGRYLQSSAAAE
jgi:hypothetical protein